MIRLKLLASVLIATCLTVFTMPALALVSAAVPVKLSYSSSNVGTSHWVTLVSTTAKSIKGVFIGNSSAAAMKIGYCSATEVADSEVAQVMVPATVSGFFPLSVSQGARISILSTSGTVSSGELDATFFYYQ